MQNPSSLIVANWKMNKTPGEAVQLMHQLDSEFDQLKTNWAITDTTLVVCPPMVSLSVVGQVLAEEQSAFILGAQDVFPKSDGPYTGAVNARMLADLAVGFCLIGHSERRQHFAESDMDIGAKLVALQAEEITAILCVGESASERASGFISAKSFVCDQIGRAFDTALNLGTNLQDLMPVIAYEPIWSIGTGQSASADTAQEMAQAIRSYLATLLGNEAAELIRILYGGSVSSANAADFARMPDIDGCLVGGASLRAEEFSQLVSGYLEALK